MLKVIRLLVQFFVDVDTKYYDARSQNLFLASTPWPAIIISFAYLYFIKIGPAWMKNRQPYTLKYPMMIYNLVQVIANSLLAYKAISIISTYKTLSDWSCLEADRSHSFYALSVVKHIHYYYLLKILDLMDTVFFVLRKHFNQISFLHVYHHFGMVLGVHCILRYGVNGQPCYLGILNCLVHVIMYFYYLVSSVRTDMKNSLWWKKYITQVQMIQFTLNIIHFSTAMLKKDCSEPKYLMLIGAMQNLFILLMFGDFYVKAYVRKHKSKKET